MKRLILFVCTGNTCRSVMAEYLLNDLLSKNGLKNQFQATSAGISTSDDFHVSDLAIQVMQELEIDITGHTSRPVTQELLDTANKVFCATEFHKQFLLAHFQNLPRKYFLLKEFSDPENKDIPDPFFGTIENYRQIRDEISKSMESILLFLRNES